MAELQTTLEEVTDPDEISRCRKGWDQHQRNDEVFQSNMRRIYRECRCKVVAVAGQELHIAQTPVEAWDWARACHPDDSAPIVRYIQKEVKKDGSCYRS